MFLEFVGRPTEDKLIYLRQHPKTRSAELVDMEVVESDDSQRLKLKPVRPSLDLGIPGSRVRQVELSRDGRYALVCFQSLHNNPVTILGEIFDAARDTEIVSEVAVVDLEEWVVVGSIEVRQPANGVPLRSWPRVWFGQEDGEVIFVGNGLFTTTDFREWGIAD